ncbi:hypothetical protein [Nocardia sp. NPDC050710]
MSTQTQRWRETRGSYRVAGEPLDISLYTVEQIGLTAAKHFVVQHHYS